MIIANQWYNIAKTSTLGSTTGIRIEFGSYYALVRTAVDYGNIVITAVESNIGEEKIKVGVRIRYNRGWFADVRISPTIDDADLKASVYENNGWTAVSPNTSTAGSTVCIINDVISQMLPSSGGESLWERVNVGTEEEPKYALVPKEYDGFKPGIVTHTFVTFGGMGSGATGEGGTGNGAVILDGLEDVQIISPTPGQILTYDEITGLWINKSTDFVTQQYVDDAINPLSDRVTELEKYFYFDKERNAVCVKEDYNFIVPKYITFGGLDTGSGEGGGGLSRVTIYLGETPYTSETGVVRLPAYPVIPTDISAFNNDKAYATVTEVNNAISTAISHLSGNINTLQDNISTLQSYFTNGSANNALMLGGQLPEYYATNSALTALSDRVTELEKLFYFDAERNAVRTSLSLIVDQWLTFGGAAMGSGSVTGATTLAALNDVHIIDPADGQFLVYDATQGLWVNKTGGVSGDYLPLTGGTITTYNDFIIKRPHETYGSYITFENLSEKLGVIGINSIYQPVFIKQNGTTEYPILYTENGIECYWANKDANDFSKSYVSFSYQNNTPYNGPIASFGARSYGIQLHCAYGWDGDFYIRKFAPSSDGGLGSWHKLIHSGNISQYITGGGTACLPLTGGTLTGNHAVLTIDGRDNSYIIFSLYSVAKASVGYYNNFAYVANENTYARIGIANDGTPQYWPHYSGSAKYTLYHSGNLAEGGVIPGTIRIAPHTGNYSEGIRIQPNGEWTAILLGGTDMTASGEGTTPKSWGIFNNDGKFYINRNGASENTGVQLCNVNDCWGIGTSKPGYKLDIIDNSTSTNAVRILALNSSGESSIIYESGYTGYGWAVGISCGYSSENIFSFYSIQASSWAAYITTQGNFVAKGSVTFNLASDRRLKTNIKHLTYRDTKRVLHRLRPVSFEWNSTAMELDQSKQGLCDGFIADEYEALIPNSGSNIWEKYRAIDYTRAIPYLAKGWQIHESELDKMRKKVKTMERRIEHLEKILVEHNIIAA